ncbi:sugar porter family MFS transporter [Mangrovibacterium diazotrophicum]|uniref:Sugar porter (SP) family MFS transporter n=1 Tax=Mangrovibacterium diazotrophicum TaxID=1261403 RepID=A0A419WAE3_9BACT|nr:sugar porter family MFS transporter [Mangrovibacterium diazotrophicum]RKD92423.1 sugar porter (SP) family MFS transporter [Mangrovibacterium diazotrophicum]
MKKQPGHLAYVAWLAFIAALGGFLFGYDTAVISGTIEQVALQFSLDEIGTGWYVGCALVGSIIGVVFAGPLSDRFGRKPVLYTASLLFLSSALGCMLSVSVSQLVIYRIIGGVGIGVASIVSPLYIAEISLPKYRGRLVALYQLAITIGFLAAYLANYGLLGYAEKLTQNEAAQGWYAQIFGTENWRAMLGLESAPALLFFASLFFIPESPRWLILKRKEGQAASILNRILPSDEVNLQIEQVKTVIAEEANGNWKLLLKPGFRLALFIGIALAILGQFMGVNAVLYYGPSIFKQSGLSSGDSLFYQVMVGLVNMLTTVLGLAIIDKVGRKQLVYWGVSGMIITLILIAGYFSFGAQWQVSSVWLLAFFLLYIFACAISICTVIFVLLSEMYPIQLRGAAMSLAGLSLWIGTYLIGQLTPWMLSNLSATGTFLLFAAMCFPYLFIVWKLLPETTGKSLEEIEQFWIESGKKDAEL